jgi:hypothetical protein
MTHVIACFYEIVQMQQLRISRSFASICCQLEQENRMGTSCDGTSTSSYALFASYLDLSLRIFARATLT